MRKGLLLFAVLALAALSAVLACGNTGFDPASKVDSVRLFVVRALERNQGNVSRAAREVGMQRPNFQALMRRHRVRSGDYAASGVGNKDARDDANGERAVE